jgi:glycosyltransferase 2 family protein
VSLQSPKKSQKEAARLERPSGFLQKNRTKLLVSALITASVLYGLWKEDISLVPPRSAFAQMHWWGVPAYALSLLAVNYFRSSRWRYLLRSFAHVPLRRILGVSFLGFAAIMILPLRIGEFVRPYLIRDKGRITMSAATGTIIAERIVDGLFVSAILAAALLWVPTQQPLPTTVVGLPSLSVATVRASGFVVLYIFIIAFVVIAVFYFARDWARKATLIVVGLISESLARKLSATAANLADGLAFLSRGRDALPFLFETSLYWLLNVGGMWGLAWACGVAHTDGSPIHFTEAAALMGMLGATVLIPGPPGLLGVFHAGVFCGMTFYFSKENIEGPGAAYAFLMYSMQLAWTIGSALFVLRDPKMRAELRAAEETSTHDVDSEPLPSPTSASWT